MDRRGIRAAHGPPGTAAGRAGKAAWAVRSLWRCARLAVSSRASPREGPLRNVVVFSYGAVGDIVFFLPVLEALRAAQPRPRIVAVANEGYPSTDELLAKAGLADELWTTEFPPRRRAREVAARIRSGGFDAAIVSHGTYVDEFSQALLSVPLRAGHVQLLEDPGEGWSWLRRQAWRLRRGIVTREFERRQIFNRPVWLEDVHEHSVSRNLRLARALGVPAPAPEASRPRIPQPEAARRFALEAVPGRPDRLTVGLHVGSPASQYGKIWPAAKWGESCRSLSQRRPLRVVVVGGADEREGARAFARAFGGPILDLTGRCGLLESAAALRRCALVLSNDTGMAKLSMALGVPTATVWGPSDRFGWGTVWDKERHLEVYREMPCSPCLRLGFPREGPGIINFSNCGHRDCLAALTPEAVAAAVARKYRELF